MKFDNFVPFGRPQSGTSIIQMMTEFDVSKFYLENAFCTSNFYKTDEGRSTKSVYEKYK